MGRNSRTRDLVVPYDRRVSFVLHTFAYHLLHLALQHCFSEDLVIRVLDITRGQTPDKFSLVLSGFIFAIYIPSCFFFLYFDFIHLPKLFGDGECGGGRSYLRPTHADYQPSSAADRAKTWQYELCTIQDLRDKISLSRLYAGTVVLISLTSSLFTIPRLILIFIQIFEVDYADGHMDEFPNRVLTSMTKNFPTVGPRMVFWLFLWWWTLGTALWVWTQRGLIWSAKEVVYHGVRLKRVVSRRRRGEMI
ncbi:hypothetical protein FPQ18DRAFT_387093 [Pyronema domesticum]|uniref:Uncharacterized protein n=1 Tax=Pyronema omphalodes (strain CBS 100304) TaxID=1076935 RepID=U4LLC3_PYROM|nr:hypothetical protein FPQ18DRAFT_387093 [Pyronema domesticum]CCX32362.1 Protein of unknown function [Pyronema omphalodes CBS 100304]